MIHEPHDVTSSPTRFPFREHFTKYYYIYLRSVWQYNVLFISVFACVGKNSAYRGARRPLSGRSTGSLTDIPHRVSSSPKTRWS